MVRIKSELELVDFLAFDNQGNFVTDLSPEEIELRVDGRTVEPSFFQLADFRGRNPQETGSSVALKSGESSTEVRGPNPVILVFDLDSMEPSSLTLARESARAMLSRESIEGQLYMLFAIQGGLGLRCRLTDDRELLLKAVEELSVNRGPDTFSALVERMGKAFRTLIPARAAQQAMQDSIAEAKIFVNTAQNQLATFAEAANGLARQLGALPGRKNVLLFSSGYPINPSSTAYSILLEFNRTGGSGNILPNHILSARFGQLSDDTGTERLRDALRRLNGSRVSIYAVNVARQTGNSLANSAEAQYIPRALLGQRNNDDASSRKAFLTRVSHETGGISGEWSASEAVQARVQADSLAYYIVAFRPQSERKPGSYGDYEVKIRRPEVQASARPGYLAKEATSESDPMLAAAFEFPESFRDFTISAKIQSAGANVSVDVSVPTEALAFVEQEGKWFCRLRVFGALVDSSGTWVTHGQKYSLAREFNLAFDSGQLEALRRTSQVTAPVAAQAPPGKYELILVARQWPSGRTSTYYTNVEISE